MAKNRYSNVGKKQIIDVVGQVIQKLEAMEMTLNVLIMFVDKEKKFPQFMTDQLGGKNEIQPDATDNSGGDTPTSTED